VSRVLGLRSRLLLALVVTSAVTLGAAALTLLPSLQDRLRRESANNLQQTVLASSAALSRSLERGCAQQQAQENALAQRTNAAQIYVTTGPEPLVSECDFTTEDLAKARDIQVALNTGTPQRIITGDEVRLAVPLGKGRDGFRYILAVRKPLDDVARTVRGVRTAFLTAALVGLAAAVLFGLALATTLLRRLERLRRAVLRVTREGPGAPRPEDEGLDEIGQLARAFAAMQGSLLRQEEARRAFVATASHELRTPLTSLQGMLELLGEDLREGRLDLPDAQAQVAAAQRELRRLGSLATELLDLSRLDAGTPLRSEPVELGEICRAVAAEFALRAEEGETPLAVEPPIGPVWGQGDPGSVAQVLRILLDNALRFSPGGAAIRVEAGYRGDHAFVAVADDGPGVPAGERELIFERFQRGSRTGGEGGFGLGLAIGREVAERQGGRLMLGDTPFGARFVLELPIELPSGGADDEDDDARAPTTPGPPAAS
jgi:signal transduction histidine kinase